MRNVSKPSNILWLKNLDFPCNLKIFTKAGYSKNIFLIPIQKKKKLSSNYEQK